MAPLPFITTRIRTLPPGRALDVACGAGRHLEVLVAAGWETVGVDHDAQALATAARVAPQAILVSRDVERDGLPDEMTARFNLVLTTYFLYRPLIPELFRVLAPGGVWLLETFHVENHLRRGHPRRRAFCLEPGEAERLARHAGFSVLSVDEGEHEGVFTTQLVAKRP
ncbi:MAG: class I SAM-dependent methyltransferase [Myxococcota bacterium]